MTLVFSNTINDENVRPGYGWDAPEITFVNYSIHDGEVTVVMTWRVPKVDDEGRSAFCTTNVYLKDAANIQEFTFVSDDKSAGLTQNRFSYKGFPCRSVQVRGTVYVDLLYVPENKHYWVCDVTLDPGFTFEPWQTGKAPRPLVRQ